MKRYLPAHFFPANSLASLLRCILLLTLIKWMGGTAATDRPNLIVIFADNFGNGELRRFNPATTHRTPQVDLGHRHPAHAMEPPREPGSSRREEAVMVLGLEWNLLMSAASGWPAVNAADTFTTHR